MLKEELTGHLRNICDLETRVQELEGKAEETKTEKNGLQERVKELETENETLRRQNRELEVSQGKRDTSEDVVQDTWNRNRDQGTTRRLGNGEAYTPRYGQDRNSQEDRHEERRRERDRREASGRMERDIYRPESRRDSERERDRGDRRRPSYNDRFDADQKPPLGPRVERR
jgi:chromosome segregation ATPase